MSFGFRVSTLHTSNKILKDTYFLTMMFNFGSDSDLPHYDHHQVSLDPTILRVGSEENPWAHPLFRSYTLLQIVISAGITAGFLYPHIGFIMEVKKGIMTRDTYPREEFSCCCVAARA